MSRLEFPRKVWRAIHDRAAGHCEKCSAVLKPGEGEVDHILPDALDGKPEHANGWLLCRVCHVAKTAGDIQRIRKADRQRDKASRAKRSTGNPIPGSKRSGWKHNMDGSWQRRSSDPQEPSNAR